MVNVITENKIADYQEDKDKVSTKGANCAVIIPALNPIRSLPVFVRKLIKYGVQQVIIVNDGSDSSFDDVFREAADLNHVTVLSHKINCGKGRALKTAFHYVMEHHPYLDGVVTADADGQHSVEDIYNICKKLSHHQDSLILGVRDFNKMPKRSYMGNTLASFIFQFIYNTKLNDTQTGLRGIPIGGLKWMSELKGERYDFEINMLIKAKDHDLSFLTVPIKTLYFDNNAGTHYSTVIDSLRIFSRLMSGLIKYSGLTIVAGIIDVSAFFILNTIILKALSASVRILICTVIARITSSLCNYFMNKGIMFSKAGKQTNSIVRYYILFTFLIICSYISVYSIGLFWKVNASIIKLLVDIALGFVSYQVQLRWVFSKAEYDTHISIKQ